MTEVFKKAVMKGEEVQKKREDSSMKHMDPKVIYMLLGTCFILVMIGILGCLWISRKLRWSSPFEDHEPELTYNPEAITTWRAFTFLVGTIFIDARVWELAAALSLTAMTCCVVVLFLTSNLGELHVERFQEVTKLLKVFVAFMLGLYVSASYNRFLAIVGGVYSLFNALKNMLTMSGTLGVPLPQRT